MVRTMIVGVLLALMVALAGCGGDEADTPVGVTDTAPTPDVELSGRALPVDLQLQMGTLMLEEAPHAVTAEQAQELVPLWQMLRALQQSGTASQVEIDAVLDQIEAVMTAEQLATIEEMGLTVADLRAMAQELGFGRGGDSSGGQEGSSGGQEGGMRPPEGMTPPAGMGLPEGMSPEDIQSLSPEEQEALMAERMNSAAGTFLMDTLIELLEARAAQE